MPTYDPQEQARVAESKVIAGFLRALDQYDADERLRLALFATGIVESNLKNLTYGDKGSIGALQQRTGWGSEAVRMDPYRSALLFLEDATERVLPDKPNVSPGVLAQLVQRSSYPDRYNAAIPAARYILGLQDREEPVVTWYPKATKREIRPGSSDPPIKVIGAILHVDGGNTRDLYNYFNGPSGGIESHFQIAKDGTVFQYRDTGREADANYKANSFIQDGVRKGYVSIETQGLENGVWTVDQLKAIKELLTWLSEKHDFPLRVVPKHTASGVGYHTMFGAPGPWTPVSKSCPGPKRKVQFRENIVPWMAGKREEDPTPEPTPTPTPKPTPEPTYIKLNDAVKPGKRHVQVTVLQRLLIKAGYGPIPGAYTTFYGQNTEDAVARFHRKNPKFSSGGYDSVIGPKGFEELQRQAAARK